MVGICTVDTLLGCGLIGLGLYYTIREIRCSKARSS